MKAPPLKKNDTIGIFAPSSWVEQNDIERSVRYVEEQGYKVHVHRQTYLREHQSAGTHAQKLAAFYDLWDNPDITCIWAAGGGNRALHWIDLIDYERLQKHPKLLVGFSDVTALINAVYAHTGIETIHGTTFNRLYKCPQKSEHLALLSGARIIYPDDNLQILREGKTSGALVGGNLSLFQYLPSTLPRNYCKDNILFLEDCNEELSRIDRMLLHLRRSGVLESAAGIIFGQFGDCPETGKPFGFSFEDIVSEHIENLNIPVIMNAAFGHGNDLYPLPIGATGIIDTSKISAKLTLSPSPS